jgi:3-phosphoglycerate kinase
MSKAEVIVQAMREEGAITQLVIMTSAMENAIQGAAIAATVQRLIEQALGEDVTLNEICDKHGGQYWAVSQGDAATVENVRYIDWEQPADYSNVHITGETWQKISISLQDATKADGDLQHVSLKIRAPSMVSPV